MTIKTYITKKINNEIILEVPEGIEEGKEYWITKGEGGTLTLTPFIRGEEEDQPTNILDREITLTNEDLKIAIKANPTQKYYDLIEKRGNEPIKLKNRPKWMTEKK